MQYIVPNKIKIGSNIVVKFLNYRYKNINNIFESKIIYPLL